jgi:hypothetical protein
VDIPPEFLLAKSALEQTLSLIPGVVGIDIGLREQGTELTEQLAIRIFVADAANLPFGLQQAIAGIPVPVVIAQRNFQPLADLARYDALIGGISIAAGHGPLGVSQRGAGTLGGFARDTLFPGSIVGVSCAHVIAAHDSEEVRQGDPIVQPEGKVAASREVGRLYRWSEPMDIAVFALNSGVSAQMRIAEAGPYRGMAKAKINDLVSKRGRTTRLTRGRVSGVGLKVFGREGYDQGFEIWTQEANPTIFCDHGDSGSLIINQNNQVVGLLTMAGLSPTWGVGVPGFVSGFAVQIIPAAAAVGISF